MSKANKKAAPNKENLRRRSSERNKTTGTNKGPKRPLNAYGYFCMEKRAEVTAKNPDLKPTEIMALFGTLWKATNNEEREPYQDLYAEDVKRYDRQMEEFEADGCFYDDEGNVVEEVKRQRRKMASEPLEKRPPPPQKGRGRAAAHEESKEPPKKAGQRRK
jgi:hypothetical protein